MTLPCAFLSTLGKNHVCRVPVNLHTANYGAHGKIKVSGSEHLSSLCFVLGSLNHQVVVPYEMAVPLLHLHIYIHFEFIYKE